MKVSRVALFGLDFPNIVNQLVGLRNGFRQLGIEVLTAWPHPNALMLENVLDSFRPDFVFEINRSRNQIRGCDEKFLHVAWMQDFQSLGQRLEGDFGGSDLGYFIVLPSAMGFAPSYDATARYLFPATDPEIFGYAAEHPIFDFSFIGQMFAPISDSLRARPILADDAESGTVGELLDLFAAEGVGQSSHMTMHTGDRLLRFVRRRRPEADASTIDPAIRNLFDDYFPRLTDRTRLLDEILSVSGKVGFFGTGPWDKWPRYRPHFGGYINRPSKMALVFRRTKVNLHNGNVGMHMRVLDCMATGGAIMVNTSLWTGTPFGIEAYFEPGRHFIEYDFDNLAEVAAGALANDAGRRRIGAAAAEAVRAGHTWRHRAMQIVQDVQSL
jgi:hypothetical protein